MRLFIAVEFEDSVKEALIKLQSEWKAMGMRGNFTPPANLHITLAFIGDYGNPDRILDIMNSVPFSPFSIRLDGIGNFDDLYWAGISPNKELSGYVNRLRNELANNGISYDKKRFSPHITLVRRAILNCPVENLLQKTPCAAMEVTTVSLMSSTRGKNGMIYTRVGEICHEDIED